jgi:hypothetical protein
LAALANHFLVREFLQAGVGAGVLDGHAYQIPVTVRISYLVANIPLPRLPTVGKSPHSKLERIT